MTTTVAPAKKFQLVGGHPALDFCNTVGGKRENVAREYLHAYSDFVAWAQQAGLLDQAEAVTLLEKATRQVSEAEAVLARAIALREAMYRVFATVAAGGKPDDADLKVVNGELSPALGRRQVAKEKKGFVWVWLAEGEALDQPLGPLAHSAADLLTNAGRLDDVRQCNGENCGWLFLDASKNHSRRWCDMRDCGNRAKVRRHRLKRRRGKAPRG